jgi:hypothetical protein
MPSESEWAAWWKRQGAEELRLILWAAWDPIGGVPRDEYETYAPQIASLLRKGGSPDDVAAALGKIRTETIGLPPNPARDREVAEKLRDWYEHPFFGTEYPSPADFKS